jgi:hypothetical protein
MKSEYDHPSSQTEPLGAIKEDRKDKTKSSLLDACAKLAILSPSIGSTSDDLEGVSPNSRTLGNKEEYKDPR